MNEFKSQTQNDIFDGCSKSLLAVVHTEKNPSSAFVDHHHNDDPQKVHTNAVCLFFQSATAAARRVVQPFRSSRLTGLTCTNLPSNTKEAEPELPTDDGMEPRAGVASKLLCSNVKTIWKVR